MSVCVPKPDPVWGCIGNVPPQERGSTVTTRLRVRDVISNAPVTTLKAKLCNKYDAACMTPVSNDVMIDAEGVLTVAVPSDFQGYWDLTEPQYSEAMVFLDATNLSALREILWPKKPIVQVLADEAKVALDPLAGIILAPTNNCQGNPASDVSVTIFPSSKETGFYLIDNAVNATATQTDQGGNAGFVNVAVGSPSLTGTLGPGGRELGKVTTLVRAGVLTYQVVAPTTTL